MADEETEGKILGLDSVIDMFRGCANLLMFLSKHSEMTTDDEKSDLLCLHLKDSSDLTDMLLSAVAEEICRQHNNFSTQFTDSPEDLVSRRDKIVLKAIEKYLQKAPK
ncbi:hypothetical protein A2662_04015 [Candidatus Giovannonibacteria bacterium RIFCSPHIGHO2_01_FULL_45_33]|uniref:Uncharacterized protein n=1 Tax=Candidatus Giovannonibacteria bacterium RIFCSPLOWO2_01_FULL_45_34 TaxID=1798351 RepID=A0A1F5X044_9BACT|nr:MAG: hypothetical protein A2662_04015 [Candidatus Giovannonibacteria bacterium RIFCSPHIGHO2_01_FULL_45_33]OGF69317.1 MAG: hypothetical protein A3C73_01760 [Candidatus Giovannonibacteria bacterium RIFCSPHIGHO2_02_FULL_44_11]OGF81266.1 MAG: hypothetical protein A2930_02280 [Candidatus Giovannonibacteria bacterium RIFCSPLOWO2_01_FULL_45_34]